MLGKSVRRLTFVIFAAAVVAAILPTTVWGQVQQPGDVSGMLGPAPAERAEPGNLTIPLGKPISPLQPTRARRPGSVTSAPISLTSPSEPSTTVTVSDIGQPPVKPATVDPIAPAAAMPSAATVPASVPSLPAPAAAIPGPPAPGAAAASKPTAPAAAPADALKPIPDPQEAGPVEIEATSFNGVTPGVTTLKEVEKAWGAPKEIRKQDERLVQLYSVKPFDHIEVGYAPDDKVSSVVIRLEKTVTATTAAQQLDLARIRPVLISSDVGEILGQAYPERGVLFSFEPSKEPGKASMKVSQIVLEPIGAETFVLRAETVLETRYDLCRHDLEEALKLQPNNARAHWLHARVLLSMGELPKAAQAASEAVRLEPANAQYHVTGGQILGQLGRYAEAFREAEKAVETSQQRPHIKARALCLEGDLAASGPQPDFRRAIGFHMEALATADPLATDRHPAIRLAAKEVLIDAHLGAAHDIAWGNWKEKKEAVTRWLNRAAAFAEELINNDGGSEERRFRVSTRALAACVGVRGQLDPEAWAKEAVRSGDALIAGVNDPLRKAQLQWDLGTALYDALQVYQMRANHEAALKYGEMAIGYLEQGDRQKQSATTAYLLGRLYFRMGAVAALRKQDHKQAVTWFDKALPLLDKPLPAEAMAELGRHGETFVSMGVSYWEAGQRDKAVDLTQRGLTMMEEAVKRGTFSAAGLAVPYANLAAMHRQLGAKDKAERLDEMAAKSRATKVR